MGVGGVSAGGGGPYAMGCALRERPCGPWPPPDGTLITSYVVPLWLPPPDASFFSASIADSISASMLVISALPLIMASAPSLIGNRVPATIIAPINSGPAYLSFLPRAKTVYHNILFIYYLFNIRFFVNGFTTSHLHNLFQWCDTFDREHI